MKYIALTVIALTISSASAMAKVLLPGQAQAQPEVYQRGTSDNLTDETLAEQQPTTENTEITQDMPAADATSHTTPAQALPPLRVSNLPMEHGAHPAMYAAEVELGQIPLQVHFENQTLAEVMDRVVAAITTRTGAWDLRWRLSPENKFIKEERVNIIAETDFNTFASLVAERIKNMTGVQLHVSIFDSSRIIAITDTYY